MPRAWVEPTGEAGPVWMGCQAALAELPDVRLVCSDYRYARFDMRGATRLVGESPPGGREGRHAAHARANATTSGADPPFRAARSGWNKVATKKG